ncbi:MAG: hypothetical protein KF889_25375 [Alphaproteobacteria bacterium]|nr:hypothetical protein [Alphaproteobacteria bacterium]MCW5739675.1 hypothetical protein [Alphaproteobacteria bacterium]
MNEFDGLLNGVSTRDLLKPDQPATFDEAVREADARQTAALRSSLFGAYGTNPDKAAKAAMLAGRAGVDPAYVERNLPAIESRAQVNEFDKLLAGLPRTRLWLTDPLNARVAVDAYEQLGAFEKFWNELKRTYFGTVQGFDALRAINAAQGGETWRYTDPQVLPLLTAGLGLPALGFIGAHIAGSQDASPEARRRVLAGAVRDAITSGAAAADIPMRPAMRELSEAKTWADAWGAFMKDPLGVIFDLAAQSSAQLAVGVGATVVGGPVAGVAATGLSSFGQEFLSGIVDNLEELGVDTKDQAKLAVALSDPALMQKVLQRSAIKAGVVGTIDAASMGVGRATLTPFVKAGLGREAANVVAQMGVQAGAGAGGEALGSAAAGREIKPGAVLAEALGELSGAPLEVAGMRWRGRGAQLANEAERMRNEATATVAGLERFDKTMGDLPNNPLAQRAPGALGEFVGEVAPDAKVYLPAEKVVEFFQSLPPDEAEALVRRMGIDEQVKAAIAVGGDVVLPMADYAQHIAAAGFHEYFKEDLRLTPGGMSLVQARDFEATYQSFLETEGARIGREAVAEAKAATPGQQVFEDVVQKAQDAGFTPDVARQYAALYAARYQARGARLGTDAMEAYRRSGLELRRVMPDTIARVPPDQMDLLIDAWRKGKAAASQRKLMGPSLLEFVSEKGGLVDEGGDLAAMDADKWHKGKPGVRKLVQDKAKLSLDDMALSAWENGYFPEFTERPTIDDLLEAMREELAGRKRHVADNTRDWRADYAAALADLDEATSRAGVGKENTNAEIKAALAKLGQDAGGYTQPDGSGMARGKIAFSDGRSIISLFARADLSTFLHETGHLWLEELRADSTDAAAQQQVRDDWAAVEKFLGIKPGEAVTVDQHERWARAVETYFMEGKAPSLELGGVFQRFKAWLVSIYRTVAGLNSPINDEIRAVMDRLVATDEQIDLARTELAAQQLFASADQAGMTDAEFAAYTESVQRARSTAETDLLRKTMEAIRRRRTREWNEEAARVRAEVREEIDQRPDLNALHYLRTGKTLAGDTLGGRMRLSKDALLDMYSVPTVLDALPKGIPPIYVEAGGVHPDILAESLGFASGREMVDALLALEVQKRGMKAAGDGRSVREASIAAEVDRIMAERHGDLLNDGSIQREALDAIHNEDQLDVLATELRSLGRKAGIEPSPLAVIRRYAADHIAAQPVREAVDVALHRRAEAKAGRAVLDAVLAGDHEEAFRQKQRQMIAHAMYVEAKKARELVEKGQRLMDRYASARTLKSMDQDYLEQIHGLLERYDFHTETRRLTERRVALRDFAARMEAEGVDVAIPEALLDEAQRRHYSEILVSEFRGLYDSVRQIAHLGRLKKELTLNKEKREFDATVDEAVAAINLTPQRGGGGDDRGLTALERKFGRAGDIIRGADASLLKIETLVDWLDGGDSNGVMNRVVFRPMEEAQAAERKLQKEKLDGFAALMKALPEGTVERWQEKVTLPGLPTRDGRPSVMLRSRLVAMALNMGNEGNRAKLLKGEGWDAEAVDAVLARELRKEDWDFVQGTWDLIETLWPQIAELERRINGVEPEKVEAREVATPHGTYRGGYYPLVYDPRRSFDVDARSQKTTDQLFENNYTRATTPKGFTKERTEGYARPLWLDLEVIPRHITEVIHDLTHREAIMQADRFLGDNRVREAIEEALGREYYKQFRPWLQSIANEWANDNKGLKFWEDFMKQARLHTTLVGMGFRFTTMLAQLGGLSDSVERIGTRALASGVKTFLRNPAEAHAFVTGKSDEMAARFNQVDQSIRDNVRDLVDKRGLIADARRFAFYGIGMLDMAVSVPTWIGAYENALRSGMDDGDAVYAANKAVRDSQGSGATKDLPAVSRRNEIWRLATMFYSYFSHLYQRQRQLARDVREAESVGDFAMIAARSWWLLVVPALFGAWAGGQGPDEDEDLGAWAARKVLFNLPMSVPVARDLASGLENSISGKFRGGYQFTPAARAGETLLRLSNDFIKLAREGEVNEGFLKRAIEVPGYLLGLPVGQLGNTSQFLWDVIEGDQSPKDIKDWLDGLVYGPEKRP